MKEGGIEVSETAAIIDNELEVQDSAVDVRATGDISISCESQASEFSDEFGRCHRKNNPNWKNFRSVYGANFSLTTGKELPHVGKGVEIATYTSHQADYIQELFAWDDAKDGDPLACLRQGHNNESTRQLRQFDEYILPEGVDLVFLQSGAELHSLTTVDVQQRICGALNAHLTFVWTFGVSAQGVVEGCVLDRDTRDAIRQTFSFAIEHEFVPPLECQNMVDITFVPVTGRSDCFLIEIALLSTPDKMYQLSSGRVFIMRDTGSVEGLPNLTAARKMIIFNEIERLKVEEMWLNEDKGGTKSQGAEQGTPV